jgi:hypothetical protein
VCRLRAGPAVRLRAAGARADLRARRTGRAGRWFVGGGGLILNGDLSRAGDNPVGPRFAGLLEAGGGFKRIGAGLEFTNLRTVAGGYPRLYADVETERAWSGLVHVRFAERSRVAADLVAGPGVVMQHRDDTDYPIHGLGTVTETITDAKLPMFTVGLNVSVRVAPSLMLVPLARWYYIRRTPASDSQQTSKNFMVGAMIRVGR